jgi:hypothetical protein
MPGIGKHRKQGAVALRIHEVCFERGQQPSGIVDGLDPNARQHVDRQLEFAGKPDERVSSVQNRQLIGDELPIPVRGSSTDERRPISVPGPLDVSGVLEFADRAIDRRS